MLKYLLILLLVANLVISAITLNKVKNSNEGYTPTSCDGFCFNKCKRSPNFSNCLNNCMENECIDLNQGLHQKFDPESEDDCYISCRKNCIGTKCGEICRNKCET